MLESPFNKVAGLKKSVTLLKRDPSAVFSYEICEIFKNTFFCGALPVAAFEIKIFLIFSAYC